jgi:hypothetical protein
MYGVPLDGRPAFEFDRHDLHGSHIQFARRHAHANLAAIERPTTGSDAIQPL